MHPTALRRASKPIPTTLVALFITSVLFAAAASPAAALPQNFFGFQYGSGWGGNEQYPDSEPDLEAVARSGARYWRLGFDCYSWYNDKSGVWNTWDKRVELAWKHGITVLPNLSGRCGFVAGGLPWQAEWGLWEEFLETMVQRYGYGGSFWSGKENKREIENWELQNEPNLGSSGIDGVASGRVYAEFFQQMSEALHSAQGSYFPAHAIVGGLYFVHSDGASRTPHTFIEEMSSKVSSVIPWIDGVAIHPYEWGSSAVADSEADINEARSDVDSMLGASKPIWITEIGWNVEHGDASRPNISTAEQSSRLTELFNWVKSVQASKKIESLIYYNYRDFAFEETWISGCGLRARPSVEQFSQSTFRPAWYAYQEETGASKWPVAPGVETQAATNISSTSATLNGIVNPHGLPTGYHFEWAEGGEGFSHQLPAQAADAGWKEGNASESVTINSLNPGTTYQFRVVAINENGEPTVGSQLAFTTREHTAAYQGPGGGLWVSSLPSSASDLHLGMGTEASKPEIAALAGGSYAVAFRSNGNELFTYSPVSGTTNTHLGMMPGSTPSIAALSGGGYVIAFQSNEGALWTYRSNGVTTNLNMGMGYSPSSPSIAPLPNGNFVIALRSYGNLLALYSPETGGVNLNQSMIKGASPSVTVLPSGYCEVAYQNGAGGLSVYTPTSGVKDVGLGMGSEPSTPDIATLENGSWMVAFRSNEGELWTYASNGEWTNLHLGMGYTPTAPSITATGGSGYEIAFKAYGEELMTYSPSAGATGTGLSMWADSSPSVTTLPEGKVQVAYQGPGGGLWVSSLPSSASDLHLGMGTEASKPEIAALAGGSYAVAFRSNGNELFTYSPVSGTTNTHLGMMPGSTPSIAALSGGGYVIAFQSNEGALWTYRSNGVTTNLNMGMGYSPSSPSIAPLPNGNFVIALRSYGNLLALYSPETGGVNLNQSMIKGASPSVTVLPSGYCEVAYQNGAGGLSVYTPTSGVKDVGLGMGSEPSTPDIATLENGSWMVAFRSNEGELWTYASNGEWTNLHLGMGYTPTAPSITATGGSGYEIAFKAYGEELMTYSPSAGATGTGLSMWADSSPSVAG